MKICRSWPMTELWLNWQRRDRRHGLPEGGIKAQKEKGGSCCKDSVRERMRRLLFLRLGGEQMSFEVMLQQLGSGIWTDLCDLRTDSDLFPASVSCIFWEKYKGETHQLAGEGTCGQSGNWRMLYALLDIGTSAPIISGG